MPSDDGANDLTWRHVPIIFLEAIFKRTARCIGSEYSISRPIISTQFMCFFFLKWVFSKDDDKRIVVFIGHFSFETTIA